ncbi:MAG: hypothetical protein JW985_02575, partial [Alphaproteobacteria bacterium]|nr:hypothetical protein [Alphaproteobacteria bacterium]
LANIGSDVALGNIASPYLTGISSMAEGVRLGNIESKNIASSADDVITINSEKSPKTPIGRKGNPLEVTPKTNQPTIIDNQPYSGHALDQMQSDGIMPTVVKNITNTIKPTSGNKPGTFVYYDPINNVSVVTNAKTNNVMTVSRGQLKQGD